MYGTVLVIQRYRKLLLKALAVKIIWCGCQAQSGGAAGQGAIVDLSL